MLEKFFDQPSERQARHGDSELRSRKISVEMRANIFCKTRARVPLLRQFVELTRANFDDCEFARDEKSVQSNQRRDYRQFKDDDPGRVPLRDRRVGERKV